MNIFTDKIAREIIERYQPFEGKELRKMIFYADDNPKYKTMILYCLKGSSLNMILTVHLIRNRIQTVRLFYRSGHIKYSTQKYNMWIPED